MRPNPGRNLEKNFYLTHIRVVETRSIHQKHTMTTAAVKVFKLWQVQVHLLHFRSHSRHSFPDWNMNWLSIMANVERAEHLVDELVVY